MTIWGVLTTEQTSVAALDDRKSNNGPAVSLKAAGTTLVEQPRITYQSMGVGNNNGEKADRVQRFTEMMSIYLPSLNGYLKERQSILSILLIVGASGGDILADAHHLK